MSITNSAVRHASISVCPPTIVSERDITLPSSTLPKHLFCNLMVESTRRILASLEGCEPRTRCLVRFEAEWVSLKCFMPQFLGFEGNHLHFRAIGPHAEALNEQIQSMLESLAKLNFDLDGYVCSN